MNISFEWDDEKSLENLRKHQIDFQVAQYAFIGAGYWRKGKNIYEKYNKIQ